MDEKKVAILIDAENTSHEYLKTIFEEAAKEGVITVKRLYGDLTSSNLQSYRDKILDFAITPVQCFAYTTGKNSADSTMIIGAMDLLYSGNVDVFCIVSSDSDFTGLAMRLKDSGKEVIGMGRQQTPHSFVKACSKFKHLDLISGGNADIICEVKNEGNRVSSTTPLQQVQAAITKILSEDAGDDGWMLLTAVTERLQKLFSDFDARNYGCKKMTQLIEKLNFDMRKDYKSQKKQSGVYIAYIRIKEND